MPEMNPINLSTVVNYFRFLFNLPSSEHLASFSFLLWPSGPFGAVSIAKA
jgi:hypothetical protein